MNPDLVVRDTQGKPYTVRYDQVTRCCSMSSLKSTEHSSRNSAKCKSNKQRSAVKVDGGAAAETIFQATVARLTARLDEKAAQIHKVSAQLEMNHHSTADGRQ